VLEKALGVRAVVDKKRDLYLYKNARIHIDEVAGLEHSLNSKCKEMTPLRRYH